MPPKTKGKGKKAGTQEKKENAGAGESGWLEVSASCFSMLWLRDQAEVLQRERSPLHDKTEFHAPPSSGPPAPRFHGAGKLGKSARTRSVLPFWLCAFLNTFITHIPSTYSVLGSQDTGVTSIASAIRDPSFRGPQSCREKVQGVG